MDFRTILNLTIVKDILKHSIESQYFSSFEKRSNLERGEINREISTRRKRKKESE